jgi:hypothetical protein
MTPENHSTHLLDQGPQAPCNCRFCNPQEQPADIYGLAFRAVVWLALMLLGWFLASVLAWGLIAATLYIRQ